jgi:hypothetical protein
MSLNYETNYHFKNATKPISSSIPYQRQVSPESEREIYEKWLHKCQEDAIYNRRASEQNNFDRIKFSREILNRVGNVPDPDLTKLYTPYMQSGGNGKNNINLSEYEKKINQRRKQENEYDLYTLDGYPRHNYYQFYDNNINGYGIKRGGTDITNLAKFERLNNGTYDEYRAKQQEILNFNVHKAEDNLRYKDYILGEKRKMGEERMKENERIRQLEYEEKLYEDEKKRVYKNLLDNQVKVKIPSKIGSLFYSNDFKDNVVKFNNPSLYLTTPENSFMNRNKLVEINPYSMKKGELGNSDLEHNPILNPVFNYKYNRYLFPRTKSSFNLQSIGQNILK